RANGRVGAALGGLCEPLRPKGRVARAGGVRSERINANGSAPCRSVVTERPRANGRAPGAILLVRAADVGKERLRANGRVALPIVVGLERLPSKGRVAVANGIRQKRGSADGRVA